MGPAVQDLWMLLSGEREDRVRQVGDMLAGYEDFCDFEARELHLIEALRTLRLTHYSSLAGAALGRCRVQASLPMVQYPALLTGPDT